MRATMNILSIVLFLILPISPNLPFGRQASPGSGAINSARRIATCNLESLPQAVREHLRTAFGSWTIQVPASLNAHARERWQSERPVACPGIALGQFAGSKTTSYALLLVPSKHATEGYRFV